MAATNREGATEGKGGVPPGEIGSPMGNEAYNIINALANKLEGMEAFRKYAKDGRDEIWREVTEHDRKAVGLLIDELEQLVRDGKLRAGVGGKSVQ
jgi:hypothetical protein